MVISTIVGTSNRTYYSIWDRIQAVKLQLEYEFSDTIRRGITDGVVDRLKPWNWFKRSVDRYAFL